MNVDYTVFSIRLGIRRFYRKMRTERLEALEDYDMGTSRRLRGNTTVLSET